MAKMPDKVRYQVLGKVFVNGSLIDPKGRKDVYIYAPPGLEGKALKLAPEKAEKKPSAGDADKTEGNKPAGEGGGGEA